MSTPNKDSKVDYVQAHTRNGKRVRGHFRTVAYVGASSLTLTDLLQKQRTERKRGTSKVLDALKELRTLPGK
jgi:hypothetical protein